jgi:DNA-binding MarR family transcriptional regulator
MVCSRYHQSVSAMQPSNGRPEGRFDVEKLNRLRLVLGKLGRLLRQQTGSDLTYSQLSLLFAVYQSEPVSPGSLATVEGVRPPSITRLLSKLEALGLVSRRIHAEDGRSSVITLTLEGRMACNQARTMRAIWLSDRVAQLTPDERAKLADLLPVLERLAEVPTSTVGIPARRSPS